MKKATLILSVFIFLLSCNDNNKSGSYAYEEPLIMRDIDEISIPETNEQNKSYQKSEQSQQQKIIKTGYFTFETKSVEATYQKVKLWLDSHGGLVQNDKTNKSYDRIHRSLLIRIPSQSFQPIVDSIYKSVKTLERRDVSLKDVTEEFVDIEARLKAKRKLEERYLQLLAKATSVKDMLEIERQIANIREEIEAKQGRLKYLQNKVSMSTIHLDFYEIIDEPKSPSKTYLSRLWNATKGGFDGIGNFFIAVVYIWPFILIGVLIAFFIKRRLRKRKSK